MDLAIQTVCYTLDMNKGVSGYEARRLGAQRTEWTWDKSASE